MAKPQPLEYLLLVLSEKSNDAMEFSESVAGDTARKKWAEKYDDLNGAPENDNDR